MATVPKLLQLPSQDTMPSLTLVDGIVAFALNAETDADAVAMAKAQNGNDPDSVWDSASVTALIAATTMSGWSLRIMVTSPLGVTAIDETVTADGVLTRVVLATGVLTSSADYANDETITIGTHVYTFKTTLTGAADEIHRGVSETDTLGNIVAAINGAAGAGTKYGTGTVAHTQVTASTDAVHVVTITAKTTITAAVANAIATTETSGTAAWGAVTMTGGVDSTDLPSTLCAKMVVALNALSSVSEAAFNNGSHVLTVTGVDDAFGDHTLSVEFYPPSEADPLTVVGVTVKTNRVGIPGFVVSKVDHGVAAAVLSVTTVADNYVIPKVFGTVGVTV